MSDQAWVSSKKARTEHEHHPHRNATNEALAARIAVLSVAIREMARAMNRDQAATVADAIGVRLEVEPVALSDEADEAMTAELVAPLEVLRAV